ncbi:hypothetical protein SK128_007369 [Halocaridina rubra]|uniref:Broad-complex n=1 Tax=Halocaridina rubra TaxID=373956 RepID=A0AAN8WRV3_HALRR
MDGELLSLKWNNHRTTFYHVISGLRNKESYTDVTLACDGKFYPVHKLVLSTCSEYFNDIFERTPCKNPVVVLKDIQCRDLEFLLDYMYIGEVNVRQNELSSLIKAAECLRVKGLAVPDEEPKKSASSVNSVPQSSSSSRRSEHSSPPAKRRRGEDRKITHVASEHSPGRPPGDEPRESRVSHSSDAVKRPNQSDDVHGDISEEPPIIIKEEKQDSHDLVNVQNSYDAGGDDTGDGPHDSEANTSEFPEFFESSIEKEEPVAISDFNPDYPGPSGLQNSGIAPWESESNSGGFPEGLSGAVAAAVAAGSQPQQQRQQQQLCRSSSLSDVFGAVIGSSLSSSSTSAQRPPTDRVLPPLAATPWTQSLSSSQCQETSRPSRLHKCPYCQHVSQKKFNMNKHIRTHTGERPFRCDICLYSTGDPSNLKSHYKFNHRAPLLQ